MFFFLIGVGIHRATRYRLSRTSWRGIRGGLEGSSWSYAWTHFWTGVLVPLTLGWIAPWRSTKLQGLISNGMRFGDRPFNFQAGSGPLYGRFAILWFGALAILLAVAGIIALGLYSMGLNMDRLAKPRGPTSVNELIAIIALIYGTMLAGLLLYGVLSAWYRASMMNHFAAHTTFEGARFSANATAGSLIWLTITNFLMVIFTLGLLGPVAQARSARYFIERMQIDGNVPLAEIAQRANDPTGRGEGLAQAFDVDAF